MGRGVPLRPLRGRTVRSLQCVLRERCVFYEFCVFCACCAFCVFYVFYVLCPLCVRAGVTGVVGAVRPYLAVSLSSRRVFYT